VILYCSLCPSLDTSFQKYLKFPCFCVVFLSHTRYILRQTIMPQPPPSRTFPIHQSLNNPPTHTWTLLLVPVTSQYRTADYFWLRRLSQLSTWVCTSCRISSYCQLSSSEISWVAWRACQSETSTLQTATLSTRHCASVSAISRSDLITETVEKLSQFCIKSVTAKSKGLYRRAITQVAGFPPRRPGFAPGQVMWDLWRTKWHWGRFYPSTSVSPGHAVA
jgi:hypothetical protein